MTSLPRSMAATPNKILPLNSATTCFQQERACTPGKTGHDNRCPACNALQECNHHLFQCPSISCQRWRLSTTSSLRKQLDSTTGPVLVNIMVAGIVSYFQSTLFSCSDFGQWSPSYLNLIQLQDSIGWDQLLGKLSHE
jgi:hypothetical protein